MKNRGRLKTEQADRRDRLETALFALSSSLMEIDEVLLRNRQAMRRTSLVVDVLDPAVHRLQGIRNNVRTAQRAIGEHWAEEQGRRWMEGER